MRRRERSPGQQDADRFDLAFSADRATGSRGGFEVMVSSDQAAYTRGETVTFTVEICNQGPATTTEGGGGSDIPFSFRIIDEDDRVVADSSHVLRTLELRMVGWAQGQCRSARGSWDQHYWNRPEDQVSEPEVRGLPVRGDLVPPGRYRVRVTSSLGSATSPPFELG